MSGPHVCTQASHAAIKADPASFAALPYRFTMRIPAGSDDVESWPAYDLVNRDCTNCGSTIAVEVPVRTCRTCLGCGLIGVESRTSFAVDSERCPDCDGDGVEAE